MFVNMHKMYVNMHKMFVNLHKILVNMNKMLVNMHRTEATQLTASALSSDLEMTSSTVSKMNKTDATKPDRDDMATKTNGRKTTKICQISSNYFPLVPLSFLLSGSPYDLPRVQSLITALN